MENNEETFREIGRCFLEIVKRLGKFIRCPGKFRKILKILRGTLRRILKKRKINFDEILWIKKVLSLNSYATPPLPQTELHFRADRWRVTQASFTLGRLHKRFVKKKFLQMPGVVAYPFTHRSGSHQQLQIKMQGEK